jgi:NADPH:quinone reductase-like Zn-dependent oxidoreductase
VERFGAKAIDYRAEDFVTAVHRLTGGAGADLAFDAIGGRHFRRSFSCLAPSGLLIAYGSQTMATGREGLAAAALGLARIKLWGALGRLSGTRSAVFYSITVRRKKHPEEFKADMAVLFQMLRDGLIHPVVVARLPLATQIGGKALTAVNVAAALVCTPSWRAFMSSIMRRRSSLAAWVLMTKLLSWMRLLRPRSKRQVL